MSSKKILVVDDDSNFLKLISMRLELAGYEVVPALNEDEAIAIAKKEIFGVSIVDLRLVHRDGISLMEEMHSINPYMPVIILTAHGSIESAVEAMKRGAFNYLNKPFDPEELLLQIERAMENQRLCSEVRRLEGLLKGVADFLGCEFIDLRDYAIGLREARNQEVQRLKIFMLCVGIDCDGGAGDVFHVDHVDEQTFLT